MTPFERFVLWLAAIAALLALGFAIYNFAAGRELTAWAQTTQHDWNQAVHEHGHGAGDHIPPPPPPPEW